MDAETNERLKKIIHENQGVLDTLAEGPVGNCPAYGKDCGCPTGSAVRAICERTAANIHR